MVLIEMEGTKTGRQILTRGVGRWSREQVVFLIWLASSVTAAVLVGAKVERPVTGRTGDGSSTAVGGIERIVLLMEENLSWK